MLEQEQEAGRALVLDRVVERLVVVRVRSRLEQDPRQLGVVDDAGGSVQRRHLAVLVREGRVRIRAALEELPGELGRREAGVADVQDRHPVPGAAGLVRVAVPAATEDEPRPRVVLDLRARGEHPLRLRAAIVGRGPHEGVHVRLGRGDERGPARIAVLAREHELGAGEDRLAPAQSLEGRRVARARSAGELLGLLAELLQVHVDLPPESPCPRLGRRRDRMCRAVLR